MHGKCIFSSTDDWMSCHAPPVPEKRKGKFANILKDIPVKVGHELDMYPPLVAAVNNNKLCPGFTLVATPLRGDQSDESKESIDLGLYPAGREPQPGLDVKKNKVVSPATRWADIDLCIECKASSESQDPFDESKENGEPTTDERKNVLGQIFSYVEFVLKYQQRTGVYMALILGDCCRLARFDRSGVAVTKKFNYKDNSDVLIEFLWRYARWSAEQRGHDPSAELIPYDSPLRQAMERRSHKNKDVSNPGDYVRAQFADSLQPDWPWWKLRVDDRKGPRTFLVGKPHFRAQGVAGRGTRGYVALDADDMNGPFYYLKDAWRVLNPGIDKEGTILRKLNKKKIRYIPTLECHGDVFRSAEEAKRWSQKEPEAKSPSDESIMQVTKTQQVWEDQHGDDDDSARCPFKKHKHYRIVVKEVGKPMHQFRNSRQLVHGLYCCVYAHAEAYKAGVIHRDISAGNVLLYFDPQKERWMGLLNDWELSKQTNSSRPEGRQLDRTGTWQFQSAQALDDPFKQITIEDELESFFHVLLFITIRFLPHNCTNVADFMHAYFDDYLTVDGGYKCGAFKGACMDRGLIQLSFSGGPQQQKKSLVFSVPESTPGQSTDVSISSHPINGIMKNILKWLKAYYRLTAGRPSQGDTAQRVRVPPALVKNRTVGGVLDDLPELDPEGEPSQEEADDSDDDAHALSLRKKRARAEKLHTHHAFLNLLKEYVEQEGLWPVEDRVEDQLPKPKKRYDPNADIPSSQMRKGGSMQENRASGSESAKRKSDQVDGPAKQRKPKRTKSHTSKRGSRRKN